MAHNLCALRVECGGCCLVNDLQHTFVGGTVEQNRAHYFLVDPALCTQRYFRPRSKTGWQARECETSKINSASDFLGALAVCDEHRAGVLEFVNILQELTIKPDGLAVLTRDEC